MNSVEKRIARERKTISIMIRMYCGIHHNPADSICTNCAELETYALERMDKCPFGWRKPTCANCPIHCYKPEMRERIRQVMRFAGPRMLLRRPVLAVLHMLDGLRQPPSLK